VGVIKRITFHGQLLYASNNSCCSNYVTLRLDLPKVVVQSINNGLGIKGDAKCCLCRSRKENIIFSISSDKA
jgi:hypothetical protein